MFTLYDLVNSTTVQGDIKITIFDELGHEIEEWQTKYCDDLSNADISDFEFMEVNYIFCGSDGFLHIELEKTEE